MKLAGNILIWVSLIVGILGGMTAYQAPLTLPDEQLARLTLNAPTGGDAHTPPLARAGDAITPELLAALRAQDVRFVAVKEFSLTRWPNWWMFMLGAAGLLAGAWLVRTATRAELAAIGAAQRAPEEGPDAALTAIRSVLAALRQELPGLPDERQRLHRVIERLDVVQKAHVPAFAAGRAELINRMGLAAYAQLMDRFAATERQINRAWSAAADGVEAEVNDCLATAAILLEETIERLGAARP